MANFAPSSTEPKVEILDSIEQIDATDWNAMVGQDYPFMQHAFLAALEHSGCASVESGWTPHHLILKHHDHPVAAMPGYLKSHSYGEYVFDWAWADAYRRYGYRYYPKWISAAPFTPACGPRLLIAPDAEFSTLQIASRFLKFVEQTSSENEISGMHVYFPSESESDLWTRLGWTQRLGVQYHWFNRGYADFDDYLAQFSSRKRKNLRKERQKVTAQGLSLKRMEGAQISAEILDDFYRFYHLTYLKRSGRHGYLNQDFFRLILQTMPDQLMMVLAYDGCELVAAALNFKDHQTLYGRYWGCYREYDFLHFETCYYQGIEYCIEQGLQRFDPGAQGEHKIQRGFEPILTYSNHWIQHAEFRSAIDAFLAQESQQIKLYLEQARSLLPFRQTDALTKTFAPDQ